MAQGGGGWDTHEHEMQKGSSKSTLVIDHTRLSAIPPGPQIYVDAKSTLASGNRESPSRTTHVIWNLPMGHETRIFRMANRDVHRH